MCVQKTPKNLRHKAKAIHSTGKTTNKLEKVGKRKRKNLQKLSPDGGGTKSDGCPYPRRTENGWEPKTSNQFLPNWPDYQVRGNTGNHEQTGAGVHKETHTPRKSQQNSPQ